MASNLLDFSNRFNPIDGRDYLVSRKGRGAARQLERRPVYRAHVMGGGRRAGSEGDTMRTVVDLHFEMHFEDDLAESEHIESFVETLQQLAPGFLDELVVCAFETDRAPIRADWTETGELRRAVIDKGGAAETSMQSSPHRIHRPSIHADSATHI